MGIYKTIMCQWDQFDQEAAILGEQGWHLHSWRFLGSNTKGYNPETVMSVWNQVRQDDAQPMRMK